MDKKINNKKLLVIGGTGFIGHNLVKKSIEKGFITYSLSLGKNNNTKRLDGVNYIFKDLRIDENLRFLQNEEFNYIVNLSGYIDHKPFFMGGDQIILEHFDLLRNIIKNVNKEALECFVNIGSSDEYGNCIAPQNECNREAPISPYSFGKLASTHLIEMLYRTEKFKGCSLRLFLTYGPFQDKKRFIPQIILGCLNNKSFPVSEGKQKRDLCYIDDVISGIFKVINSKKVYGQTYNLASGKPIEIQEVIRNIVNKTRKGLPFYGGLKYRTGENMSLYADINKIKNDLNWEPKISLDEGLEKTINWYLKNEFT